jgi:ferric-dicitrate binding protein FerR (iron transport regulator)
MSERDPRKAALDRLVREARAEKTADIEWSGVEERLMREARRSAPRPRRSAQPWAWGALAAAAGVALWMAARPAVVNTPQETPLIRQSAEALRQNGDTLAVGSRVEAGEREVSVDHAGRATWTLAPDSSALLAEKGERIALHLERGSVLSRVVRSPKPETFVVEAANTRVAVHGTVFRVGLVGARVLVDVQEGTVAVGPAGAVPAFLLKAPARGDFAADGHSGSIDGRPVTDAPAHRPGPSRQPPSRMPSAPPPSSATAPAASAELPLEPSINDIEVGIARVVDVTSDCFSRHTQKLEGLEITVHTALSLKISDSGAVSDVDFQPPLSPEAEACAAASIAQIAFAPSKQGTTVTRMLELKR